MTRSLIILPGFLIVTAVLPATAQNAADLPKFKKPPVSGTVSGSRSCVSPYVRQGGVLKQVDRGIPPPYVPEHERVTGVAAMIVPRPVERTYVQFLITTSDSDLPGVARSLGAERERLASVLEEAGVQVLSIDLLGAAIDDADGGTRPGLDGPLVGNLRVGALLAGKFDPQAATSLIAGLERTGVEHVDFDFAPTAAVAEDLRPELEPRAQADAAALAADRGAALSGILASELLSEPPARAEQGRLSVTAKVTFSMTGAATADAD